MFGFLMTVAFMFGVMFTIPYWGYSRNWGSKPCLFMSLATLVVGLLWYFERI